MAQLNNFQFSQSSLQDFIDCPRRFELRYFKKVHWPAALAKDSLIYEEKTKKGQLFHHLIHQYCIGIPVSTLRNTINDEIIANWFDNFLNHPLFDRQTDQVKSEIALKTRLEKYPVIAKFDALVFKNNKYLIFDWKTTDAAPQSHWFEKKVQTRLYPLVLSKLNNPVKPESIEMIYWNANHPKDQIHFPYSEQKQLTDSTFFLDLIQTIKNTPDNQFLMTPEEKTCRFCTYRSLCNRGKTPDSMDTDSIDMESESIDFEKPDEVDFSGEVIF